MNNENIEAITKFLFIEDDINKIKQSDLILILCNNNINGIASSVDELFQKNIITNNSKIVISGNRGPLDDFEEKECILVYNKLVNQYGYNKNMFLLEDKATNINENLTYIKELINDLDRYDNILIIGAAFALRRIKLNATRLGYPIERIQYYGTVNHEKTPIGKDNWWLNEISKKRVYEEIERIGNYLSKGDLDI